MLDSEIHFYLFSFFNKRSGGHFIAGWEGGQLCCFSLLESLCIYAKKTCNTVTYYRVYTETTIICSSFIVLMFYKCFIKPAPAALYLILCKKKTLSVVTQHHWTHRAKPTGPGGPSGIPYHYGRAQHYYCPSAVCYTNRRRKFGAHSQICAS